MSRPGVNVTLHLGDVMADMSANHIPDLTLRTDAVVVRIDGGHPAMLDPMQTKWMKRVAVEVAAWARAVIDEMDSYAQR